MVTPAAWAGDARGAITFSSSLRSTGGGCGQDPDRV